MPARRSDSWVAVALFAGACARSPTATAPPSVEVADTAAAARPWTTTILPASTSERMVAVGPTTIRILEGRRRLGSDAGVIADIPGAKLVEYDVAPDGTTIFVDELGSLYRAPSFTGTLTALPTEGVRWRLVRVSAEHAFVCAADGVLARVPLRGAPRIERLREPCTSPRDPLPLRTQAHRAPAGLPTAEREAAIRALERSYDERYGGSWAIAFAQRGDDARFWSCSSSRECAAIGSKAPRWSIDGQCELQHEGATMVALCRREGASGQPAELAIHQLGSAGWVLRARMPWPDDVLDEPHELQWIVGEGGGVVIEAPCRAAEYPDIALGLCWLDGDEWRSVDEPDAPTASNGDYGVRFVALADRWLVVEDVEASFARVDLSSGAVAELTSLRAGVVAGPVFRGDVLLAAIGGREPVVVAREGDVERRVSVPRGAKSVGFASAKRFLAAGTTADQLWTSVDGGTTWTVLDVPVDGDPRAVALEEAHCTNAACMASPVAWVDPALLEVIDHHPPKLVARPR